jgi:hypothetical protein
MTSFPSELFTYVRRVQQFERTDWFVYCAWVGLILGLVFCTAGFLLFGRAHGVRYCGEAWWVPTGAAIFAVSIAVDTIGHRTVYREEIAKGEALVHGITIFMGITSCLFLCAAYESPAEFWIPAAVATFLSIFYSVVDEVFHWRRYLNWRSDRVEMWSHVGILSGHLMMMVGWWVWFARGYPGVKETLALF